MSDRPKLADVLTEARRVWRASFDVVADDGPDLDDYCLDTIRCAVGATEGQPVVLLGDNTLTVAERECVAEGHTTAVFDSDGTAEVWHDPDDGPCEWVWRIPGAES